MPASGYMGAGPQDITFYDMRNTLNMTYWESTKVMWTDVQTKNGVIHVLFRNMSSDSEILFTILEM